MIFCPDLPAGLRLEQALERARSSPELNRQIHPRLLENLADAYAIVHSEGNHRGGTRRGVHDAREHQSERFHGLIPNPVLQIALDRTGGTLRPRRERALEHAGAFAFDAKLVERFLRTRRDVARCSQSSSTPADVSILRAISGRLNPSSCWSFTR